MALDRVQRRRRSFAAGEAGGPRLFTPFRLRDSTLANRIIVSPMGQHSAREGLLDDWHLIHLGQFALSGVGLVFTGSVAPEPNGRITSSCLGLWNDDQVAAFGRLRRVFSDHSESKLGIQLNHCGRKGSTTSWQTGSRFVPIDQGGWLVEGPSAIPFMDRTVPAPMSRARIEGLVESFAGAAARADQAGFDVIELHAAHGYLLHQFLSPLSNCRDDEFGGALANRLRFPLRVFEAVRKAWPAGKPIGVRVSATDWVPGGWSLEETLVFSDELKRRGCDYICVSSGGTAPEQDITVGPLYQAPFAAAVRRSIGLPTVAVGMITTPLEAESLIADKTADLVAIGRAMVENPHWAWAAARELGGRVSLPANYVGLGPE